MPGAETPIRVTISRKEKQGKPAKAAADGPGLTLDEAAAFLRVPAPEILRLVKTQGLPARDLGGEWRFLRSALETWLATPADRKGLLCHVGAIKNDPTVEEFLQEVYQKRGRSATEEG